ncbi:hypothetical protein AAFF_G00241940 [Aldrovandia affinis]|uniref:Endonuclease/exonuclease/phosphatase domain-containing protein n=1 Tax=Aldrovandia affinis TaxID=143900 RepID=A0AAD7SVU2_9TELE|nr:hypothetical protein AAFF_G00241940 [Aldrovandia affinis]
MDMDVELESLSSFLDRKFTSGMRTWPLSHRGRRLEVFRDPPGCLSTALSVILCGDFNVCLDGRDGVGEGSIDYSARALAEVVKNFTLVDAFRALHLSDAGFTWRNSRGAASHRTTTCCGSPLPWTG